MARLQHEATGAVAAVAGETLEQENRRLRREVTTLRQKQACVKSGGVLRQRVALRRAVIARHQCEFTVRLMCRVLEVSTAGVS